MVVDLGARVTDIAPMVEVLEADDEQQLAGSRHGETELAMPVHS